MQLQHLLRSEYDLPLTFFADWKWMIKCWKQDISKENLYQRRTSEYFTMADLERYIDMLYWIIDHPKSTRAEKHYARIAQVVLSITISQTGKRTCEVLGVRPQSVYFGEAAEGQVGVAFFAQGSKTDIENQRSSAVSFMPLENKQVVYHPSLVTTITFL